MTEGIKLALRRNLSSALDSGDYAQAELVLARLAEEDPLSVETRGLHLDFLVRSGRLGEAGKLASQLILLFPGSPRVHYLAGQLAYRQKKYGEAAERFRESNRLSPHWRSLLALARSLTQLGEMSEASALFENLLPEHAECYRDMAWLYERKGDFERALAAAEAYLKLYPNHEWVEAQRIRLKARVMAPEDLVQETQELLEFGEEPPESCVPQYVEALFRTGKSEKVREFLMQRRGSLSPRTGLGIGWVCYRMQAYDLAWELFVAAFPAERSNPKFLAAFEFAATRAERLVELITLYEAHASSERPLYGRLRRLRRKVTPEP